MPIYRYQPVSGQCRLCDQGFDLRQASEAAPLTECPKCGQEVRREVGHAAYLPKHLARPSVSQAKQAGFAVLRRTADGSYEKA